MTALLVLVGLAVAVAAELFERSRAYDHGPVGVLSGYLRVVGLICGPALAFTAVTA